MAEYIYLIKEREFIKTNENIIKLGRTSQNEDKRFKQYPKGSKEIFKLLCKNSIQFEKELISLFKKTFTQRKDIGNEYFEGDYLIMMNIIFATFNDNKSKYDNNNCLNKYLQYDNIVNEIYSDIETTDK